MECLSPYVWLAPYSYVSDPTQTWCWAGQMVITFHKDDANENVRIQVLPLFYQELVAISLKVYIHVCISPTTFNGEKPSAWRADCILLETLRPSLLAQAALIMFPVAPLPSENNKVFYRGESFSSSTMCSPPWVMPESLRSKLSSTKAINLWYKSSGPSLDSSLIAEKSIKCAPVDWNP